MCGFLPPSAINPRIFITIQRFLDSGQLPDSVDGLVVYHIMIFVDNLQDLDRAVESITKVFLKGGFSVYPVGGCVRDSLLGRKIGDIDLATSAKPEQVKKLFRRVIDTGIKHGTVTVLWEGKNYEVTTFRHEEGYSDNRHPDKVYFLGDLKEDLCRRDFTINAMAWDPIHKDLIDPFHGKIDLGNRILRCVGNPRQRFQEDPLRIFRLFRFHSQLGFTIEPKTLAAAVDLSERCERVSWERKRQEWNKLLCGPNWVQARQLAQSTKMLPSPPYTPRIPPYPEHLSQTSEWSHGRWAYHYWERGFPSPEAIEHDLVRFRSSRNDLSLIIKTWKLFSLLGRGHYDVETYLDVCQDREFLTWLNWVPVFKNNEDADRFFREINQRVADSCPLFLDELPINGTDLRELGLEPGPRLGVFLQHLLAYNRMNRQVMTKNSLSSYAEILIREIR